MILKVDNTAEHDSLKKTYFYYYLNIDSKKNWHVTSPSVHEAVLVLTIVLKLGEGSWNLKAVVHSFSCFLRLHSHRTVFLAVVPCLIIEIKDIAVERLEGYRNQRSHSNMPQLRLWLLTYPFIHLMMCSSPSPFLQSAAFSKVILEISLRNDILP